MESRAASRWVIPPETTPGRLDRVLTAIVAGEHSRTALVRLMREGRVLVNGRPVKVPATEIGPGAVVEVDFPEPEPLDVPAEDLPLVIVYEDEHLLVVNKAAGMVTHPAGPLRTGTLVNALLHHVDNLSGIGGVLRPGIVHRLDAGTTGLLVVAKTDGAHRRLAEDLQRRDVKRTYVAFAWGKVEPDEFVVDAPIGRHPRDRQRMAVVERGRDARTHVRVVKAGPVASRLEVKLETGRTHQIRVHLSHRGHPLVGDSTYGGRRTGLRRLPPARQDAGRRLLGEVARPALHARRLEFPHPASGEAMRFEAPVPSDLCRLEELLAEIESLSR